MPINPTANKSTRAPGLLLFAFAAALAIFAGLGSTPLIDPDEPVYAQAGLEMLRHHTWIVPWFDGHPLFDKPFLFYALEAASQGLLGAGAVSARIPSALASVLLALVLARSGARWFGGTAGRWAAWVSISALYPMVAARAAVTDATFTTALFAGILWLGETIEGPGPGPVLGAGAALAAATLVKGPVVFALVALLGISYAFAVGSLRPLLRARSWAAIAAGLGLSAPWFLYMALRYPDQFVPEFFGKQNVARFLTPEHAGVAPWFFLAMLPVMFLPWPLFAPSLKRLRISEVRGELRPVVYLMCWAAVVLVFFSLSATKLITYVLPAVPALSLLVGAALSRSGPIARRAAVASGLGAAALVASAAAFVAPRLVCYYSASSRAQDLREMAPDEELLVYKGGFPGTLYYAGRRGTALRQEGDLGERIRRGTAFRLLVRPRHAGELKPYLSQLELIPGPSGPWGEGLRVYRHRPASQAGPR